MDDAASKHDSTTSPEASIKLNKAAYQAHYYVAVHIGLRAALADMTARLATAAMGGERVEAQMERGWRRFIPRRRGWLLTKSPGEWMLHAGAATAQWVFNRCGFRDTGDCSIGAFICELGQIAQLGIYKLLPPESMPLYRSRYFQAVKDYEDPQFDQRTEPSIPSLHQDD